MNINFPIDCYRSGIIENTENVFSTMLNATVTLPSKPLPATVAPLTAAVYYAGSWQGALLLECSEQQARAWSGRIMDLVEPTVNDARDGLGELANVLAGNLKPVLPAGVSISIPSVVEGRDYSLRLCGGNLTEQVDFFDGKEAFRVTLVKVQAVER